MIERAEERRRASDQPTIFFLDEIHRFNKAQQDALLPAVEEGLLTLIGATTENPYFEVNSALLSRAQIYELRPLGPGDIRRLLDRALQDPDRGLDDPPEVEEAALELLAGALRRRRAHCVVGPRTGGRDCPRPQAARSTSTSLRRRCSARHSPTTGEGDRHYDYISAWIKATRASDPDASLYYLAVMLEGGEDARFIARRMVDLRLRGHWQRGPAGLVVGDAAALPWIGSGSPNAS